MLGKYIVKMTQIIHDAQRRGGNGSSLSVCKCSMKVMLHRKALVSSLAVFVKREKTTTN